jgi:hypothetical protein
MLELRSVDGTWPTDKLLEDLDFRLFEVSIVSAPLALLDSVTQIGDKVDARDHAGNWYPAEVADLEWGLKETFGSVMTGRVRFVLLSSLASPPPSLRSSLQTIDLQSLVSLLLLFSLLLTLSSPRSTWPTTSSTRGSSRPSPSTSKTTPRNGTRPSLLRAATSRPSAHTPNQWSRSLNTLRRSTLVCSGSVAVGQLGSMTVARGVQWLTMTSGVARWNPQQSHLGQ